jgi:hypothetical protein
MALFLLENRDFLGFRMIFKVPLNQIFSNFNTMLYTIKYRLCLIRVYFTFTIHKYFLHQFTFLSIPSLQVCFHHMSYNQCFDVNSERKTELITGNLI